MQNNYKKNSVKILFALAKANGPAPLDYITNHSGIEYPLELIQQLEKDGFVQRPHLNLCCPSLMPLFELTNKAKTIMLQATETQIERLIEANI